MAEELDTEEAAAQAEAEAQAKAEEEAERLAGEDEKPFTPEQEQYMGSWMGRIIKKQFDESIVPLIEGQQRQPAFTPSGEGNALTKFNEEITEQFFGGDPLGAFNKMQQVSQTAKSNLSESNKKAANTAITGYSEDPLYKEIYADAQRITHEAVANGHPPEAAADYGIQKAKVLFFEKRDANLGNEGLDMSVSGIQQRQTKTVKLPPEFKKAFERDKEKGLFKDEADYIKHLSPTIRAKYGI